MKKALKRRSGFTLVELLIVIIIIGILAGAMLLVAGSGTDKAEATKIVSDMRSLKAAALLKYADDSSWAFVASCDTAANTQGVLGKYMDRDLSKAKVAYYLDEVTSGDETVTTVIGDMPATGYDGVQDKLVSMAGTSGLYDDNMCATEYDGGDPVYMRLK